MSSKIVVSLISILLLAGCTSTAKVRSIEGACDAFRSPTLSDGTPFAVRGKTRTDDKWVTSTQATGIKVCDWPRPKTSAPADE